MPPFADRAVRQASRIRGAGNRQIESTGFSIVVPRKSPKVVHLPSSERAENRNRTPKSVIGTKLQSSGTKKTTPSDGAIAATHKTSSAGTPTVAKQAEITTPNITLTSKVRAETRKTASNKKNVTQESHERLNTTEGLQYEPKRDQSRRSQSVVKKPTIESTIYKENDEVSEAIPLRSNIISQKRKVVNKKAISSKKREIFHEQNVRPVNLDSTESNSAKRQTKLIYSESANSYTKNNKHKDFEVEDHEDSDDIDEEEESDRIDVQQLVEEMEEGSENDKVAESNSTDSSVIGDHRPNTENVTSVLETDLLVNRNVESHAAKRQRDDRASNSSYTQKENSKPKRQKKSSEDNDEDYIYITTNKFVADSSSKSSLTLTEMDVVSQVLSEQLNAFVSSQPVGFGKRALEAYAEELEIRFVEMCDAIDAQGLLSRAVRKSHRRVIELREELLELRKDHSQIESNIVAIREKNVQAMMDGKNDNKIKDFLSSIADIRARSADLAKDYGVSEGANKHTNKRVGVMAELQRLVPLVCGEQGLLKQLKSFNDFLEKADRELMDFSKKN
ncbi:hypothetical protein V1511DRAFT_495340 [Dipodascopsis uninucleata]